MQSNDVKPSFFDLNYPEPINLLEFKNLFKSKNENIKLSKEGLSIFNEKYNISKSQMEDDDIDIKSVSSDKTNSNNENNWGLTTHIYIGSITVIGLFILFRLVQKSKH